MSDPTENTNEETLLGAPSSAENTVVANLEHESSDFEGSGASPTEETVKDGPQVASSEPVVAGIETSSLDDPITAEGSNPNADSGDGGEDNDFEDGDEEEEEDEQDSDDDFPRFEDRPRGRIVGPVSGQRPPPKPKPK